MSLGADEAVAHGRLALDADDRAARLAAYRQVLKNGLRMSE